ncbi:MAG: copper amine oxidase N-terminal domain-containing protein [Armatimonadota bacterium]
MRKIALWLLLALVALAGVGAPPLIYTGLEADVYPELRAGRVFAPISPVCKALGAGVAWNPDTGKVRVTRADGPEIVLTLGSTTATVGGKAVTLDAAPYVKQGRTMVPVRFLAEGLGVPVAYHAATRTVRFPVGDRLYILPLPDTHPTIVFENPAPGATVGSPILVQGVGSAWEGDFPHRALRERRARRQRHCPLRRERPAPLQHPPILREHQRQNPGRRHCRL